VDLMDEDGPRISTMRNYRFALLQYDPVDEFAVRQETQRLFADLKAHGWEVLCAEDTQTGGLGERASTSRGATRGPGRTEG
jgi:hypothetical protein